MSGSFVVSILIGVTTVMAVALTLTILSRRRRAATRHALLTAAFGVALVLPVASAIAPYVTIRVPVPAPRVIANAMASFDDVPSIPADLQSAPAGRVPAVQRSVVVSLATVLEAIWFVGLAVCLAPVAIGLLQMRSLGRRGLPWAHGRAFTDALALSLGLRRRVGVVLHESVSGPMTYGTLRPTIVMPVDAESWTEAELTRAIVHELEHIRRVDWLTQCLAWMLCAVYWFHPLVWIARRQLVLEAERASDDAVLRYAEASAYADQLVNLARRLSAGHQPVLAMANRHDLAARVHALLDGRQPRGRAGAWLVAAVSCIAAALIVVLSPMRVVAGSQQQLDQVTPVKFDVASIKQCAPNSGPPPGQRAAGSGPNSPGYLFINCLTFPQLLNMASGTANDRLNGLLRNRPEYGFKTVREGPSWVDVDRFIVEARSSTVTDRKTLQGPMLLALLEERFQVKFHRATEDASVYVLRLAAGGLKLQPVAPDSCFELDPSKLPLPPGTIVKDLCGTLVSRQPFKAMATKIGKPPLAGGTSLQDSLSQIMDRVVVDQTGLDGRYDVEFTYAFDDVTTPGVIRVSLPPTAAPPPPPSRGGPTIFKALETLGLKLEPGKSPVEYLVIDAVSKLRPN